MFMCWQNQNQILKFVISEENFESLNARECPQRSVQTTTCQWSTRSEVSFSWSNLWSVLEARAQRVATAGRSVVSTQALEHPQCFSKELPLGHNQQDWGQTITWPPLSTPEVIIIFKQKFLFLYFLAVVWPWAQILTCEVYDQAGP